MNQVTKKVTMKIGFDFVIKMATPDKTQITRLRRKKKSRVGFFMVEKFIGKRIFANWQMDFAHWRSTDRLVDTTGGTGLGSVGWERLRFVWAGRINC